MIKAEFIAQRIGVSSKSVTKVLELLDDGCTIPFIARYRKEATGSLDEVAIQNVAVELKKLDELIKRKEAILQSIDEQGKLSESLLIKIKNCFDPNQLEDIYAPYKKKRKTKAEVARKLGLEPLAKIIMAQNSQDIYYSAKRFVSKEIKNEDEAIAKALDIVIEWISENETFKERFRESFRKYGEINSKVVKTKKAEASTYHDYFDFSERLSRCPSHRYLAMLRGENEGLLRIKLAIDDDRAIDYITKRYVKRNSTTQGLIEDACKAAYKNYILPSVENQIKKEFKEVADEDAIRVFSTNLEQLLLAPPFGNKPVLAIDPGFRTGCKVACINEYGDFLKDDIIYPNEPQNQKKKAEESILTLIHSHQIKGIAIGNGTASRETKTWIDSILGQVHGIEVYVISESGASIYSASEIAREEFPNLDLTVRGAISLARRLLDPLSELIKVDPKSIGVGQYQHDVNQSRLKEALDHTVVSCVNRVGVDLNTTSHHLLSYISGLGIGLAKNIVQYRIENGSFKTIESLKKVPRLGEKAFEQCAGFLRVREGENPLDNTGIHPESYPIVAEISKEVGLPLEQLLNKPNLLTNAVKKTLLEKGFGQQTVDDVFMELAKPGHDPRGRAEVFEFDKNIISIEDLKIGMKLPGIVSNLTNFGAFVDIGIKQDGLVHISQISDRRISSPMEVLSLNQKIWVKVVEVDVSRNRISLSMKQ